MRLKERPFLLEIAVARRRSPFPFGAVFAFGEPGAFIFWYQWRSLEHAGALVFTPKCLAVGTIDCFSVRLATEATQFADRKRPLT
jgi:hypothetical protein